MGSSTSQAMFPSLFHPASIEANSLWHAVAQLEGIKVFVAHSMVSFFASYIGTTGDTSAHLAEYHLGGDPYFAIRRTPLPDGLLWIGSQPPVDRPLVFLDRSFSGSTLSRIRQLSDPSARLVAWGPKSLEAVLAADYIVFDNVLMPAATVPRDNDWYTLLLRQTRTNYQTKEVEPHAR